MGRGERGASRICSETISVMKEWVTMYITKQNIVPLSFTCVEREVKQMTASLRRVA